MGRRDWLSADCESGCDGGEVVTDVEMLAALVGVVAYAELAYCHWRGWLL